MLQAFDRMKRWLAEDREPRRAPRIGVPKIIVHYWQGTETGGHEIRDISESGAYIYRSENWYPGTIIRIVLQAQRMTIRGDGSRLPDVTICLTSRVVRHGDDGVAVEFLYRDKREKEEFRTFLSAISLAEPARSLRP